MPIELLQEKVKAIPAEYVGEVSDFIDFILQTRMLRHTKIRSTECSSPRRKQKE